MNPYRPYPTAEDLSTAEFTAFGNLVGETSEDRAAAWEAEGALVDKMWADITEASEYLRRNHS